MILELTSDIFDTQINVLVHCTNCFCTMGSGIALEIKKRFPEVYAADLRTLRGDKLKLGTILVVDVSGHKYIKQVVNLYGQYKYGVDQRQINYEGFYRGLCAIKEEFLESKDEKIIGFPYEIGCGRGGGSWIIIRSMIEDVFKDSRLNVLICEKPQFENLTTITNV